MYHPTMALYRENEIKEKKKKFDLAVGYIKLLIIRFVTFVYVE